MTLPAILIIVALALVVALPTLISYLIIRAHRRTLERMRSETSGTRLATSHSQTVAADEQRKWLETEARDNGFGDSAYLREVEAMRREQMGERPTSYQRKRDGIRGGR